MASKPRISLRRKTRISKEEDSANEADDAFEELKSPIRKRVGEAGVSNVHSPRIRSAIATPTNKSKKYSRTEDTFWDENSDKLSQEPTPSKWSCLLPDYYSSQADGAVCDVLWDCASPDAIKHLRRRRKDDKSIKEILKHFKDGPPKDRASRSPSVQLHLLRTSLQQQQHNPSSDASRQQRKLIRKRKLLQQTKEQTKQLFDQILSAVEKRRELEAQQEDQGRKGSEMPPRGAAAETAGTEDDDNDDCWEDDDLFEDNSFIINATQDPYQFLKTSGTGARTPKRAAEKAAQSAETSGGREVDEFSELSNINSSSVLDSQSSGVIPPTLMPGRPKPTAQPSGSSTSNALGKCENSLSVLLDAPRSRFPAQRQRIVTITPKRLLQPSRPSMGPDPVACSRQLLPVNSSSDPVAITTSCVLQSGNMLSNLDRDSLAATVQTENKTCAVVQNTEQGVLGRHGSVAAGAQQRPWSGGKHPLPSLTSSSAAKLGTMLQSCTLSSSKMSSCVYPGRPPAVNNGQTNLSANSSKPVNVINRPTQSVATNSSKLVSVIDRPTQSVATNITKLVSVIDRPIQIVATNSSKPVSVTDRPKQSVATNITKLVSVIDRPTQIVATNSSKPVSVIHRPTQIVATNSSKPVSVIDRHTQIVAANSSKPVSVSDRQRKPIASNCNSPVIVTDRQTNLIANSNKPVTTVGRCVNAVASCSSKPLSATDKQTKPASAASNSPVIVPDRQTNLGASSNNVIDRPTKPVGAAWSKPGARQTKPVVAQNCVGSGQVNQLPDNASDHICDDGLSDELLRKLTEEDDEFDSQVIQEFPTQAPSKLSAPVNLTSVKTVSSHCDDFVDDLDLDLLASICEYDSFSESPKHGSKTSNPQAKGVPLKSCEQFKSGPSDEKQRKLEESNPRKSCNAASFEGGATSKSAVHGEKKRGSTFYPPAAAKPSSVSNSSMQNYRNTSSTVTLGNAHSGNSHGNLGPNSHGGLVYPPFAQSRQARPLSSLAEGNTITDGPSQMGKKFVFRSVNRSCSATLAAQHGSGVASACSKPPSSKDVTTTADALTEVSCGHTALDRDDDLMGDDALYESQIIALLDEVETQATQQSSWQCDSSQGRSSPLKCSQEQIEKKRQAALQRKLQSKAKTK